eukprot:sb/3467541/
MTTGSDFWSSMDNTYFDVRIFNPRVASNSNQSISKVYEKHEREKKTGYLHRVIEVEKSSFTPLVMSTTGGLGREFKKTLKQLADKKAKKTGYSYEQCIRYLRLRLSFAMVRSITISIRGHRGRLRGEGSRDEQIYQCIHVFIFRPMLAATPIFSHIFLFKSQFNFTAFSQLFDEELSENQMGYGAAIKMMKEQMMTHLCHFFVQYTCVFIITSYLSYPPPVWRRRPDLSRENQMGYGAAIQPPPTVELHFVLMTTGRHGNWETWQLGDMATGKHGNWETWQLGDMTTARHGN